MQSSVITFTNKPQKPPPLDDNVWRQKCKFIEIETNDIESILEPRYFSEKHFQDSQMINNYTIRSIEHQNYSQESDYVQVDWQAYQLCIE